MDFVRFSGELFIYYALIALGGGVLVGFTMGMFRAIAIDAEPVVEDWLLPCGMLGAVIVGSWLVEAKQSVIENMAPVLTRLFTPLFALTLVTFLGTMVWTGRGIDIERNALIAFDLLLVLVLALLLYSISARDPQAPPGAFDLLLVLLLVSALVADAFALAAIGARISEFGFTPNRVAALGENVVLLGNLGWSTVLYVRFLRGRGPFASLERWQTAYLPAYSVWAAIVVVALPAGLRVRVREFSSRWSRPHGCIDAPVYHPSFATVKGQRCLRLRAIFGISWRRTDPASVQAYEVSVRHRNRGRHAELQDGSLHRSCRERARSR